jgi:hypothetical protein
MSVPFNWLVLPTRATRPETRSEDNLPLFPSAELIGDHKARLFLHRGAAILSIEGKHDQDERLSQIICYGLGDDAHRITPIRASAYSPLELFKSITSRTSRSN